MRFYDDKQAILQVIWTGKDPAMRWLTRIYGVSVAFLRTQLGPDGAEPEVKTMYETTEYMCADIDTKVFMDTGKTQCQKTY